MAAAAKGSGRGSLPPGFGCGCLGAFLSKAPHRTPKPQGQANTTQIKHKQERTQTQNPHLTHGHTSIAGSRDCPCMFALIASASARGMSVNANMQPRTHPPAHTG